MDVPNPGGAASMNSQPAWGNLARIVLQVAILVFFVLTSVRLLLTRAFIRFEYALPGFPPDRYGFTTSQRIHHADIALEYLLNQEGIEFLGDLELEDGSPVYNARELRHMSDVKQVTRGALRVWAGSAALAVVLAAVLWRVAGSELLLEALMGAARLTAGFMLVLLVGLVIGFSVLFVGFHRVFFEGNTWIFNFRDTLIRLFPERFWQVAFGTIALATLAQGGVLYGLARWLSDRSG